MREAFFSASNGTEEQPIFITHSWVNRVWFFFFIISCIPLICLFSIRNYVRTNPLLCSLFCTFFAWIVFQYVSLYCTLLSLFHNCSSYNEILFFFRSKTPRHLCVRARIESDTVVCFFGEVYQSEIFTKKDKKNMGKNSPTFHGLRGVAAFFFIQRRQQCIREQSKTFATLPHNPDCLFVFLGDDFFFHFWRLLACSPQSQFVYTVSVLVKLTPLPLSCLSLIFGYNIAQTLFFSHSLSL